MDGILLIDKPLGPTSHDVVARIRRATGESRVGHTGTLNPRASGLLPLVLGRATRLASRITGGVKTYEAEALLGVTTDTDDAAGQPIGLPVAVSVSDDQLEAAFEAFRGTFEQMPPDHSAKKVDGQRAYDLARRSQPVVLKPAEVTVLALRCTGRDGATIRFGVTATAGFYVRALARDLGRRLGCGAHLTALRRTGSGSFDLRNALPLDEAERLGRAAESRLVSPAEALPGLVAVTLNEAGLARVLHGNALSPGHLLNHALPPPNAGELRLLAPDGRLVALAHSRGGALHPVVVLG